MPFETAWQQLCMWAVAGTQADSTAPAVDGDLADVLNAAPGDGPEERLLTLAACAGVYRRAGVMPTPLDQDVPAAGEETLPRCSPRADDLIARCLCEPFDDVLPELLGLVAAHGQRVPERHLPALLDRAANSPAVCQALAPVMGQRGGWLAQQNAAWRATDTEATPPNFETGTLAQRVAVLEKWRQADPHAAREALEKTWPAEPPDARAALLGALGVTPCAMDEPFLETALSDKNKYVRRAAADLLARLPVVTQRQQRMLARLRPLVSVTGSAPRNKLSVVLPAGMDKDLTRDGIAEKSDLPGMGDLAYQLAAIIGGAGLAYWTDGLQLQPLEAFECAEKCEFNDAVQAGLMRAAIAQSNAAFARAGLQAFRWLLRRNATMWTREKFPERLLAVVPLPEREAVITGFLGHAATDVNMGMAMLVAHQQPWSRQFSLTACAVMQQPDRTAGAPAGAAASFSYPGARRIALYMHPDVLPTVTDEWSNLSGIPAKALHDFLQTLHFRQEIHKEFHP